MKELIKRYQDGGKNALIETIKYATPGVGSYYSILDAIDDPSLQNILSAGGSVVGDILLLTGAGAAAKIPGALRALNNARKAQKAVELTAKHAGNLARHYASVGDIKAVDQIMDGIKAYYKNASELGLKVDDLLNTYKNIQSIAETGLATGTIAKGMNTMTKAAADNLTAKQNMLKKQKGSDWLYNDFSNTEKYKSGGIVRRQIQKYQNGNGISWADVGDAASYMIPVYGTYRSVKDAINDPSFANWGLAGLSFLGDVATLAGGSGMLIKGASAASKGAKYAKGAQAAEREAMAMAKHAEKLAPLSGKYWTFTEIPSSVTGKVTRVPVAPAKLVTPEQAKAVQRTINAIYSDAEGMMRSAATQERMANMYKNEAKFYTKQAGGIAAGGIGAKGGKSVQKVSKPQKDTKQQNAKTQKKKATVSNGDLVKKRTEPFLYNNFQKKDGGTVKHLVPKHQEGNTVRQILDAGEYMLPIYGTYKSWRDVYNDPTWTNLGLAGLSTLGDAALIFGGAGMGLKSISTGAKAAKAAEKASKLSNITTKLVNNSKHYAAQASRAASKTSKASSKAGSSPFGNIFDIFKVDEGKVFKEKSSRALNAATYAHQNQAAAEAARDALLKTQKRQRIAAAASTGAGSVAKGIKASQGSQNLVEKRKTPYLYNNFQK